MNINFNNSNNRTNFKGSFDSRFLNSAVESGRKLDKAPLVRQYLFNVKKMSDDATEFAKDWHSTFKVTNYKLGDAEALVDTKVKPELYPVDMAQNNFDLLKFFSPKVVQQAEADLFRDFVTRNGLANNPIKALNLLKSKKIKPETMETFIATALKMKKEL